MREEAAILGLSPAMAGGLFGLLVGIVSFIVLRMVAAQIEMKSMREGGVAPERSQTATLVRFVALFDLFLFPAVGYFIGPLIAA